MKARFCLLCALICATSTVSAEELHLVRGTQIRLSDVLGSLPEEMPDLELGPAPPPGGSRLVAKREILDAAIKGGVSLKALKLPQATRVTSAVKRWSTDDLVNAALPLLATTLPSGVSLKHAKTSSRAVTSPSATVSAVRLSKLPRREGDFLTTATIELSNDGQVVARVPLALSLDISSSAAAPAITKGSRLQLVIENGPARIAATAIAMSDGEVGDTLQFRVASTQKVLYGKVEDPSSARVVQ